MPGPSLTVADLSEFEGLTENDEAWLERLAHTVKATDHLVRLGDAADESDPIVRRNDRGRWQAGRYIGELVFEQRRLEITPRLGELVIEEWLGDVLNLIAAPATSDRQHTTSFIARLMAAVWCRALAGASRHGPPAFRRDHLSEGLYIRGRLDVKRTTRTRANGHPNVASVSSRRVIDNDLSRTIVAAERTLRSRIGHDQWHTPRVRELLPQLQEAVGARPTLPTQRALARIRYTPITRPFKQLAELSWRIAKLEGLGLTDDHGRSEGLLLDVAELWELFLLAAVRRATPSLRVEHGTTNTDRTWLLTSADGIHGLGRLKPDILVSDQDEIVAVLDAKYKRLENGAERPAGVDREDLYQLTSYLARYTSDGAHIGALLYPDDPKRSTDATAETHGPWTLADGPVVRFARIPLSAAAATRAITQLIAPEPGTIAPLAGPEPLARP